MARPRKRLTDYPADLRAAIADAYEDGSSLAAIAEQVGVGKDLVGRLVKAMIKAGDLAERKFSRQKQTQKGRAVALESRIARRDRGRDDLSDLLLHELGPTSARRILARLAEDLELEAKVAEARQALDDAVLALEVLNAPDDAGDPDTPEAAKLKQELRRDARARLQDARLILAAYAGARIPVRTLVGILSRAVVDHLSLESQTPALPPQVILEFGASLPSPTPPRVYDEAELRAGTIPEEPRRRDRP